MRPLMLTAATAVITTLVAGVAQALAVLLPGIEPINVGCGNQLWFHAAPQK